MVLGGGVDAEFAGEEDGHGGCFDEGGVIRAGWGCGEEMILGAVSTVICKLSEMGERDLRETSAYHGNIIETRQLQATQC